MEMSQSGVGDHKAFLHKLRFLLSAFLGLLLHLRHYWLRFYLVTDLINCVCHLPYVYSPVLVDLLIV